MNSLIKRDNVVVHISISEKGGDFVVNTAQNHKSLTINHIKSSTGVYQWIPPTRKYQGDVRLVQKPTDTTFRNQIKSKCNNIEQQCNSLLQSVCKSRDLENKFEQLFASHHSSLLTMYVLLKTHIIDPDVNISDLPLDDLKVRPIVSCSGSPTEKLAWLATHVLSPLLEHVPSHLANA